MPTACERSDSARYAARHNPPIYFTNLSGCRRRDVSLSRLAPALGRDSLPAFSFITPNTCDDSHDCPLAAGDRWLAGEIGRIVDSAAYRARRTVLFITFDEGEGGSASDCATNESDAGCHVATVAVSPSTPAGRRSGELFTHYSLLRATEDLLGLAPLGAAAKAADMAAAFGLRP
jgi:hypothetical protein